MELPDRVTAFNRGIGEPKLLVNDLWDEIARLRAALEAAEKRADAEYRRGIEAVAVYVRKEADERWPRQGSVASSLYALERTIRFLAKESQP